MLTIISPAKKLDMETPAPASAFSEPAFLDDAEELVDILRRKGPDELQALMKISPKLAELNARRFAWWHRPFTQENAKQALFAFRGDVYAALDADSLDDDAIAFAQDHLRILSGLYGLLRPLDLMQAYRLEMGTRLANPRGRDLYAFWGERLTAALNAALNEEMARHDTPVLLNLASGEYARAVSFGNIAGRVIHVHFKERRDDGWRVIGIHAKKARGMMCRFILERGADDPEALRDFREGGYAFRPEMSTESDWVFAR